LRETASRGGAAAEIDKAKQSACPMKVAGTRRTQTTTGNRQGGRIATISAVVLGLDACSLAAIPEGSVSRR
jgi:hypothetical protein